MKILVINPGSTTTKLAVFEDQNLVFEQKLDHAADPEFQKQFSKIGDIFDQFNYRLEAISNVLKEHNIEQLDGIVGRGGMLPPVISGTYVVNDKMIDDLKNRPQANHASNLGAALALELARSFNINDKAFIVDPVTTDEIEDKFKITGIPEITRYAGWHALNQKAVARHYAKDCNKPYESLNLIVAHLGGGFSFGAHKKGKVINVYNALAGEGPMTPERSGQIPAQALIELCFSGKEKAEIKHLVAGGGGLFAHFGTKDLIDLEKRYSTMTQNEKNIIDSMFSGISRSICSLIPDFEGEKIDQILITGGVAYWKLLIENVRKDLASLCIDISVYPGEKELEALRDGAIRVLTNQEQAKEYK